MAIAEPSATNAAPARPRSWFASNWGLILAIAALVAVLMVPTPAGLPVGVQIIGPYLGDRT